MSGVKAIDNPYRPQYISSSTSWTLMHHSLLPAKIAFYTWKCLPSHRGRAVGPYIPRGKPSNRLATSLFVVMTRTGEGTILFSVLYIARLQRSAPSAARHRLGGIYSGRRGNGIQDLGGFAGSRLWRMRISRRWVHGSCEVYRANAKDDRHERLANSALQTEMQEICRHTEEP